MISDSMTIPNRAVTLNRYAAIVVMVAFVWQFLLQKPHGLICALFLATPLVTLLNRFVHGARHEWRPRRQSASGRPA